MAEQDFDQCGFAGAVWAEDGEDLAGFEGKGNVGERRFVGGIREGDAFGLEDWISHVAPLAEGLTTKERRNEGQLFYHRNSREKAQWWLFFFVVAWLGELAGRPSALSCLLAFVGKI